MAQPCGSPRVHQHLTAVPMNRFLARILKVISGHAPRVVKSSASSKKKLLSSN